MPHIVIHLSGAPDPALAQRVAREVTSITAAVLRKEVRVTAVTVQFIDPNHWFIGGESLSASGGRSFFLEISVTDETNTKPEKSDYLEQIHAAMNRLLGGDVAEHSYVHVADVRAAAYGYGGRTQEWRYQRVNG